MSQWNSLPRPLQQVVIVVLIAAVLILAGAAVRARRRRRIRDWSDAEVATARWLRRAGCRAVRLTKAGADAGIDVITSEWAVQVKHTAKPVGRPAVQQLVGAALTRGLRPALFSSSGFTEPAATYAAERDVALFHLDSLGRARALNRPAHRLGRRRRLSGG